MKTIFSAILLSVFAAGAVAQQEAAAVREAKVYSELVASTNRTVKGAPFSAEAVSESIQVLADGNRIVRRSNTKMFRDSEGRYRSEGSPAAGGVAGTFYSFGSTTISDPVSGFRYVLFDADKSARRSPIGVFASGMGGNVTLLTTANKAAQAELSAAAAANKLPAPIATANGVIVHSSDPAKHAAGIAKMEAERGAQAKVATAPVATTITTNVTPGEHPIVVHTGGFHSSSTKTETESLGTRDFFGVNAEGTRTVTKIPAGAIGNEREIEVVYEKWYSKDLQMIVYSKHSDPRYGDQTYTLTSLSRAEPDASLFTVPADYKIKAEALTFGAGSVYTMAKPAQGSQTVYNSTAPAPVRAIVPKKEQ